MKKTQLYIILPLVAIGIFVVYYHQFSASYAAKMEAHDTAVRQAKEADIRQQNENMQKAVQEALAAQELRKKAKAEKEAAEAKRRDERESARQALSKAQQDAATSRDQVERLRKEVATLKEEIKKIEDDKAVLVKEETFLKDFVKTVESHQSELTAVLTKIDAANAAWAAAARAAALAATKKS